MELDVFFKPQNTESRKGTQPLKLQGRDHSTRQKSIISVHSPEREYRLETIVNLSAPGTIQSTAPRASNRAVRQERTAPFYR